LHLESLLLGKNTALLLPGIARVWARFNMTNVDAENPFSVKRKALA